MQLADSDAGLYTLGVLANSGLDAEVSYPDVHPVQVQGPKSAQDAGEARRQRHLRPQVLLVRPLRDRRHPRRDQPHRLDRGARASRSTCSTPAAATELWDAIMAAGEEFDIRPIAPNEARRVEAGHLQLGIRHHAQGHAVPRHGPGAAGRGAASGLHRQGRAGAHPPRRRRPQAGRDRVRRRRAADRDLASWPASLQRPRGRQGHRRRVVAGPGQEHRLRVGADRAGRAGQRHRRRVRARHAHRRAPRPSRSSTRARSVPPPCARRSAESACENPASTSCSSRSRSGR